MRILAAIAAAAALGLAACTPADQNAAEQDVDQAAEETGQALDEAGSEIGDAANEAGEAVEGAVNDAATEVDHATDDDPSTN
jgi:hypothetical protein